MNIVFIDVLGFPDNLYMASVKKKFLLAKGLATIKNNTLYISNTYGSNCEKIFRFEKVTVINHIEKKKFKLFSVLLGKANEFFFLKKITKKDKTILIVSSMPIILQFYYYLLKKIFGFKLVLNYMELNQALNPSSIWSIIQDSKSIFIHDMIIPISKYLQDNVTRKGYKRKQIIIPAISEPIDETNKPIVKGSYILFCASIGYYDVFKFVLAVFYKVLENLRTKIQLVLIVNGNEDRIIELKNLVLSKDKLNKIQIYSKLPEKSLKNLYINAEILLMPLRENNLQDLSRFPQKIAEYLATGNPVVTNPIGIVNDYLIHKQNAYICKAYNSNDYTNAIITLLKNKPLGSTISSGARLLFEKEFHYVKQSIRLNNILKDL